MKNDISHDESPTEEEVKKGFEEAADQVAKYLGWNNDEVTGEFERLPLVIIPDGISSPKEIAEIMAKSLNEENWKELENMGAIIKKNS